jgi:RluA family pseudouridine synthase
MLPILFEDDYFIVAAKPAGIPSQPTVDKSRPNFYSLLQTQLETERGPGFYLALHHRLDRGTSGIMIFAKTKIANTPLADLFKNHQIQKTYLCFTKTGKPPETWQESNFLSEIRDPILKKMKMISVRSGGKKAITDFRIIEKLSKGFLVEARPRTGRMHQIRVHLAEKNLGIFGDDIYSCLKKPQAPRLMLHAFSLEFIHPFSKKNIKIEMPIPDDMQEFKTLLR